MTAVLLTLWVLLTPTVSPDEWSWSMIDVFETREACESRRDQRFDRGWTICARLDEMSRGN